jgi:two-component system, OmpR family, response regulator
MVERTLRRILLVEDEPDIQTIAGLSLRAVGGFEVEVCGSGAEALDRFPSFSPDLVVLDVMMPGLTGPATFEALQGLREGASVPVVFMTAKIQPGEVDQLMALGAAGVIAKPFDPMALAGQIRALWEKHTAARA